MPERGAPGRGLGGQEPGRDTRGPGPGGRGPGSEALDQPDGPHGGTGQPGGQRGASEPPALLVQQQGPPGGQRDAG
jgi:hypothetical protein